MDFEIPTDLSGLSAADLREIATQARAAGRAVAEIPDADITPEQVKQGHALIAFLSEVDSAIEAADAADAEHAAQVAGLKGAFEEPAKEEAKAEEVKAEEVKEPVAASGNVTSRAAAAAPAVKADETVVVTRPKATITAAADVPTFATGSTLTDLSHTAQAAMARLDTMPRANEVSGKMSHGIAVIKKGRVDGFSMDNPEYTSLQSLLQAASKEARLPGGSLTAAGGWCAPSETVYDLCTNETTDGLWDLPEVQARRGGLQFTKGPNFADIYALGGFEQTEAQAEAGATKACWNVPCPDFEDVRLDVVGLCITAGILTRAAYPELIQRYIEGALVALQHRISAKMIAQANTIAGAATSLTNVWPNATSLLTALELVAQGERQRYRLSRTQTLEVVLPFWVKSAIRADLSQRTGVELTNVTDQMIDAHFTARGLRVQFIYNYQPLTLTGVGNVGPATDYPSTLEALIYPAGTFVKLTNDVISLNTIYDSTGLSTNTYTGLFAEEGVALANTCFDVQRISLPLNVSGLTAAANINQDWGSAPPLVAAAP